MKPERNFYALLLDISARMARSSFEEQSGTAEMRHVSQLSYERQVKWEYASLLGLGGV